MKPDRDTFDTQVTRLLQAARPAYPSDLDWKLQVRLANPSVDVQATPAAARWPRLRVALAATVLLLAALGLLWHGGSRPGAWPTPPGLKPTELALARLVPPLQPEKRGVPGVPDRRGRANLAPMTPGLRAQPSHVRLEFVIPDKNITIVWEQTSDFDLAKLGAGAGE
jgi:hypothetical protein